MKYPIMLIEGHERYKTISTFLMKKQIRDHSVPCLINTNFLQSVKIFNTFLLTRFVNIGSKTKNISLPCKIFFELVLLRYIINYIHI